MPGVDVAQEELRRSTGPAGRRRACPRPGRARRRAAPCVGVSVVRGRLPGASDAGWPSSSQNICARVPRQKPSSGITGEDCSQPPDGVAETMLPARSMMSKCTVSPRTSPSAVEPGSLGAWSCVQARRRSARRRRPPRRAAGDAHASCCRSRRSCRAAAPSRRVRRRACAARRCRRPTAASRSAPRRNSGSP